MLGRWFAGGLALALGVLAVLFWRDESARASDSVIPPRPAAAPSEGIAAPPPAAPAAREHRRAARHINRYDETRHQETPPIAILDSRNQAIAHLITHCETLKKGNNGTIV